MLALDQSHPLLVALAELQVLGGDQEREAVDELRGRLAAQRLRVLVAGEAKRGKSTLVNALLGRSILPAGVTPLTALATTVRHGRDEGVTAVFPGGRTELLPLTALEDLVTERGNPDNSKHLSSVTVSVDAPLLVRGIELVDTPGTGSVYGHNTAEAEAALQTMDAAVFVLTADPPVSAREQELIAQVTRLSVTTFIVLNKADHLSGAELSEVLDFTAEVVGRAAGQPMRIYPVSARAALADGGDAGFAAFQADLTAYLDRGAASDLRRAITGHACRLAGSLRDEVILLRRASQMRGTEAEERVSAFAARLAAVRDRRRDAVDLAAADARRLLDDLNEAARRAEAGSVRAVTRQLSDLLDGDLRSSSAADIERVGRARLEELAVAEAEAFRRERAEYLEAALIRTDDSLTSVLRAEFDGLRAAASELLGLDLSAAVPGQRLAPSPRFFYSATSHAGQTELLAGAIRRRLPGQAGRNRARQQLLREAAELVPQQIGRARADLQYRLAEASRHLIGAVGARYDEGTRRLSTALAEAARLRSATTQELTANDENLARRLADIDRVLALLSSAEPLDASSSRPAATG
jgi:small GTP-binding protein